MFLSSSDVMSGNVLSCLKGVKDTSVAQEGRWDFSGDTAPEKVLSWGLGENLLVFLELQQKIWGSSLVMMGTSGTSLCGLRKVQSSCEL